jgi:exopolyphosphatase / guanosine-5'-triphosphate,3'-diphosphate pyrophosphatase
MRLGVLDIGSNSAQLQVVELAPGAPPLPAHSVKEPTLLAEAFDDTGAISDDGVERVTAAVAAAVDEARRMQVERLFTFATSAIRDASNSDAVLDRIERAAGLRPSTLSGEEEARLTYLAVRRWYGWSSGRLLLLDIGGGSMEIALGRDAHPELALSLPLGAGRLTREFITTDPPGKDEVTALRRHVEDCLSTVADRVRWEGTPKQVIATSKTFKQLARLSGAPPRRSGPFVPRSLSRGDLRKAVTQLTRLSATQRSRLRGVSEARAPQIVAGAVVAKTTMKALGISQAEICPWALREGIMLHYLETAMPDPTPLTLSPLETNSDADPAISSLGVVREVP